MKNTFTMINNQTKESYDFEIKKASFGEDVVDISSFYAKTRMFTYDPGFTSTASCASDITYINGKKGELYYRGYKIDKLVKKYSYLDVCYLLLNKKLPNLDESKKFQQEIMQHTMVHEGIKNIFSAFPAQAHPMALMSAGVSALSAFYFDDLEPKNDKEYLTVAKRVIAKIPTLAAYGYRYSKGLPYVYPDSTLSFAKNFLNMLRAYPSGKTEILDIEVEALDTIFSLHADHEQNASTSTLRVVGSTGAHPYGAITAAINALWGRAHGGANESVIAQLSQIGDIKNVDKFIKNVKDPNHTAKLMGFGHRVYKNFDPRASILKGLRDRLKDELKLDNNLIQIADKIENIALNDSYFIDRNLYPNIDFYSGVILTALKIPKNMFTVIFVIGRTVGWISHWIELKNDNKLKIARPRQLYLGEKDIEI